MIRLCHWPDCQTIVAPRLWGCVSHGYRLPLRLRVALKNAYRSGQEIDKNPSSEYCAIAREIQEWINANT